MATFLEMAQAARILSGIQGTGPSSVSSVVGIEEAIVRFVRDAYIDIQNIREDWSWLMGSQSFTTQAGKSIYTAADMLLTSTPRKYKLDSFIITYSNGTKSYLPFMHEDLLESMYLNDTTKGIPTAFTERTSDGSIILKPTPSGALSITFAYQKVPEVLSTSTQVPLLPLPFHNLIVYKAVEKLAIYLGSPEIYRGYSVEVAKMLGQLMRNSLPKMRLKGRPLV